jgi:hypothetical protein
VRRIMVWLGVSAVAGLAVLAAVARADDQDKLPRAVADAVKGRFPGASVTGVEKGAENGNVVYDVELRQGGSRYEVGVRWDGVVLVIEKEVAAKDLPAAVAAALGAKYPGAVVTEAVEVSKVKDKRESLDHYEVGLVTADGKEREVKVSPDGKSVRRAGDKK